MFSFNIHSMNKLSKHIYTHIYLYEKKEKCLFKKKKNGIAVLCTEQEKQLYYSGLCLHYPGHMIKPSLKKKKKNAMRE